METTQLENKNTVIFAEEVGFTVTNKKNVASLFRGAAEIYVDTNYSTIAIVVNAVPQGNNVKADIEEKDLAHQLITFQDFRKNYKFDLELVDAILKPSKSVLVLSVNDYNQFVSVYNYPNLQKSFAKQLLAKKIANIEQRLNAYQLPTPWLQQAEDKAAAESLIGTVKASIQTIKQGVSKIDSSQDKQTVDTKINEILGNIESEISAIDKLPIKRSSQGFFGSDISTQLEARKFLLTITKELENITASSLGIIPAPQTTPKL